MRAVTFGLSTLVAFTLGATAATVHRDKQETAVDSSGSTLHQPNSKKQKAEPADPYYPTAKPADGPYTQCAGTMLRCDAGTTDPCPRANNCVSVYHNCDGGKMKQCSDSTGACAMGGSCWTICQGKFLASQTDCTKVSVQDCQASYVVTGTGTATECRLYNSTHCIWERECSHSASER
mmetsp:Transcript_1657/g.3202  ORF Transcript_1657/g.3202 Transcript_1657/m.3202 type:complete len:178 (-) Transcript_1657:7-540(-)